LIIRFREIALMRNIIEDELFKIGLFPNNQEQINLIENRYSNVNNLRSQSHNNLEDLYTPKNTFVRQHSF
jgi:hypothetical protein